LRFPDAATLTRRIALAAVIVCAGATSAFGADEKPDAVIKTKHLDASVLLEDGIKKDAALAAECLGDGKKWLAKNAADTAKSVKDDPDLFKDGPWTFERRYAIRSVVGDRYVSILRSDYSDTHAAHPNSDVDTILWDRSLNKPISIRPFLTETADNGPTMKAIREGIIASLKIEKKKREFDEATSADYYKSLPSKLIGIGAVTLAPSTESGKSSGLTFHYPPYAVGSYVEGEYVAFVPWTALKPFLTPEGTKIFGGARPKGDEESPQ
jgi:hypothetical protein